VRAPAEGSEQGETLVKKEERGSLPGKRKGSEPNSKKGEPEEREGKKKRRSGSQGGKGRDRGRNMSSIARSGSRERQEPLKQGALTLRKKSTKFEKKVKWERGKSFGISLTTL